MEPAPSHDADSSVLFRPNKRRKTYRQRPGHPDPDTTPPSAAADGNKSPAQRSPTRSRSRGADRDGDGDGASGSDEDEPTVAAAVRLRSNIRRARFRGVGFAPESRPDGHDDSAESSSSRALAVRSPEAPADDEHAAAIAAAVVQRITGRFMRQTGLIADLNDRHMYITPLPSLEIICPSRLYTSVIYGRACANHPRTEYIESRLSSRNALPSASTQPLSPSIDRAASPDVLAATSAPATGKTADQPTKHGKLFEVDIPDEVRNRRDGARRRPEETASKRRFGRNRRGSDDIKRDQFVEQFLRENRLDVYDVPKPASTPASNPDDKRTADERMAEQFRRQYLDELAQRRQRRRNAHPPRQQPPPGDVLKGPKLGGSRNARAAVRNALLQQEKEKVGRKP
ncbi:hypothetical protein HIM_04031 [Hirsutella minnesotensis 3608]|uniref:Uncharacterized protein n=1 Tax=Hirsutella minnesotensis 3608 TaxID=1043627 RepID=A0A0F7ZQ62_9HYPO|nr:hypothetical protein HIM_04031 [Hirsutella minnesotensis 3608]